MKVNQWTLGLAAAGVISFGAVAQAEEKPSSQVLTAVSSTTLSGYVSTSAMWAPGTSAGGANATRTYDGVAKQDGFSLDVINLTVSKPLDEGEWAAGYTAELLVGPDATVFATGAGAQLAIKQAYVALNAPVGNGITFKLGVWDCPIGYEAFNYTANPNYSRSIGYAIEPTTYTGLIASYKVCDGLTVGAGVANNPGGAVAINGRSATESEKAYCAHLTVTAPDSWGFLKGSTITAGVIDHDSAGGVGSAANVINYYVGGSFNTPIEALKIGAAYDYQGRAGSGAAGGATSSSYANAVSLYTSYALTEKVKINTRAEYASGTSSAFTASAPFANAAKAAVGSNSEFLSITGTVDYALWANVISRAEIRWDADVSGGPQPFGGAADEKNAITIALNVIYKF
ncbi:MAG: Uncharacterized protein FD161_4420 [Limisphaerales bacterium]|nr:MAG: Uncharacterized protein FD161_4420 [Limisphaerales bacterium]KAG0506892.1 MAG: Uncharacterized protein E1N63_3928 [Limisphaerales bacterium]TXT51800.1 MAG: Uncharacterized protein FD140_1188 [Limisphaerales bacterium]